MAIFTVSLILGGLAAAGLSYFFIGAVGTLMHFLAVAGGIVVAAGGFYRLDQLNPLNLGEVAGVISYASISAVAGFLSYRVFEAVFAAASTGIALLAVILAVLFVLNPSLVFNLFAFAADYVGDNL